MSKNVYGTDLCSANGVVHTMFDNFGTSFYQDSRRSVDITNNKYTDAYATKANDIFQKTDELCFMSEEHSQSIKTSNIYRYKISEEVIEKMYSFSKIHQYDHRKDFKAAWELWLEENEDIVNYEKRRLLNLGYDGDVLDKMFKSARYYFRKKSTEKKAPKERRNYIGVDKSLLSAMDEHLKKSKDLKPELSFDEFCKENMECLKNEVSRLIEFGFEDPKEIQNKIKKTYKNRYFMMHKKQI